MCTCLTQPAYNYCLKFYIEMWQNTERQYRKIRIQNIIIIIILSA